MAVSTAFVENQSPQAVSIVSGRLSSIGVSVLVPAYNEEQILESNLEKLEAVLADLGLDYEIVVVDDASRDSTFRVAKEYSEAHPRVKAVTYDVNGGKGCAIKRGFGETTKAIVGYIDADIEIRPDELVRYVQTIENEGADAVVANKWDPRSEVDYAFTRKFLSYGFGTLVKIMVGVPLFDTQCGVKFFRREVLEKTLRHVKVDRFGFDVELLAYVLRYGYGVRALPITVREVRTSRVNWVEMLKMFKDIALTRMRMMDGEAKYFLESPRRQR